MHPSLKEIDHRPWPMPKKTWSWRQSWCDLLFLHWAIEPKELRKLIPEELELDLYDGAGWIGVVPFYMRGVMKRPFFDLPYFSAFGEINVRTYVKYRGKPGVWFFSLDATNICAVWAAKQLFHLPYFHSWIEYRSEDKIYYNNARKKSDKKFIAEYKPVTDLMTYAEDTFEIWASERYCLYSDDPRGNLYTAEIHHKRWPLQDAEFEIQENTMLNHLKHGEMNPKGLFSKRIDVVGWPLQKIASP